MDNFDRDDNGFINIEIEKLYEWNGANGEGCIVSDKVTKEGYKVGYMYHDEPAPGRPDSGWRFLAGNEDEDYMNNSLNHHIFSINTICNYDRDIIPYLNAEVGKSYIRINNNTFEEDNRTKEIYIQKQDR